MTDDNHALTLVPPQANNPQRVRFVELPVTAMAALLVGDLVGASAAAGVALTPFFLDARAQWLWTVRIADIAADPASARWISRAAVSEHNGLVVGYAGFHGPPDALGMVEVGYSVDPQFRRQGYARAILAALLKRAASETGVTVVRASISPGNVASLATLRGFGFVHVGEQMDEEDGLELLFEIPAAAIATE